MTFSAYSAAKDSYDAYSATGLTQADYDSKWSEFEDNKKKFMLYGALTGGLYILNLVDAYFSGKRVKEITVSGRETEPQFFAYYYYGDKNDLKWKTGVTMRF